MAEKKHIRWMAAVLTALLLTGCGGDPAPQTEPPDVTQVTNKEAPLITAPQTTQPQGPDYEDPTEPTEPPPSLDPVSRLQSISWDSLPELLSLGEGLVLAAHTAEENGEWIQRLDVIDVYEDQIVAHEELNGPRELVAQSFADGSFALRDPLSGELAVYDCALQQRYAFTPANAYGYFSRDLSTYYYVDSGALYHMDTASGNYGRMALQWPVKLESLIGVHPTQDVVVARFYLSFHHENTGVCAIDCGSGNFVLLNEAVSALQFDGNTFYALQTNDKTFGTDLYYGSLEGGVLKKALSILLGGDSIHYTLLGQSGFMVLSDHTPGSLATVVYDFEREGICSRLQRHDYESVTYVPVYLAAEQLIVGVYPNGEEFSPVVIDPKVLSYEKSLSIQVDSWPAMVDKSIILKYEKEVEGAAVSAALETVRAQADALEQTYGVAIRLGSQTLEYCGSFASVEESPETVAHALTVLEAALKQYPEDFFRQFRNKADEGGICIWLTGKLDGPLNTVGRTMKLIDRYDLVLDIRSDAFGQTFHHELWHAVEMKLPDDAFAPEIWQQTNPEGFHYYNRYDSGYEKRTQWTYEESGKDCCFVDPYSQINPREDRARIMEAVMSADDRDLLTASGIEKKLQLMSDALRNTFDTTNWDTPYWERYL